MNYKHKERIIIGMYFGAILGFFAFIILLKAASPVTGYNSFNAWMLEGLLHIGTDTEKEGANPIAAIIFLVELGFFCGGGALLCGGVVSLASNLALEPDERVPYGRFLKDQTVGFFGSHAGVLLIFLFITVAAGIGLIAIGFCFPDENGSLRYGFFIIGGVVILCGGGSLLMSLATGDEEIGSTTTTSSCPSCGQRLSIFDLPANPNEEFPCPHCGRILRRP